MSFTFLARFFLALAFIPLLPACHRSGTWQEDAGNWQRAFEEAPTKDLKVLHSWYWRSPHFTFEFECFFALAPNETFRKKIVESGGVVDITPTPKPWATEENEKNQAPKFFHEKPGWFIPKPIDNYEIWKGKPPQEHFHLFIDRQTGELFITDFSV